MEKTGLTFFTEARTCGQNTMSELLFTLANTSTVVYEDTNRLMRTYAPKTENGASHQSHLVCEVIMGWLAERHGFQKVNHAIISGSPLDEVQCLFYKKVSFPVRVVHITGQVIPGLEILNDRVLELPSSMPLRERMEKTIRHIHVPKNVKVRLLRRLAEPSHPVSIRIDELDGKRAPAPAKPTFQRSQFSTTLTVSSFQVYNRV